MVLVADGAGDPDGGNNMICIVVFVAYQLDYTEFVNRLEMYSFKILWLHMSKLASSFVN